MPTATEGSIEVASEGNELNFDGPEWDLIRAGARESEYVKMIVGHQKMACMKSISWQKLSKRWFSVMTQSSLQGFNTIQQEISTPQLCSSW